MALSIYAGSEHLSVGTYTYVQHLRKQFVTGLALVLVEEVGRTSNAAEMTRVVSQLLDCLPEWQSGHRDWNLTISFSAHERQEITAFLESEMAHAEDESELNYEAVNCLRTEVLPSADLPDPLREAAYGLLTWCDQSDCDAWLSPGTTIDAAIGLFFLRTALEQRGFDGGVMTSLATLDAFFARAAAQRLAVVFV